MKTLFSVLILLALTACGPDTAKRAALTGAPHDILACESEYDGGSRLLIYEGRGLLLHVTRDAISLDCAKGWRAGEPQWSCGGGGYSAQVTIDTRSGLTMASIRQQGRLISVLICR